MKYEYVKAKIFFVDIDGGKAAYARITYSYAENQEFCRNSTYSGEIGDEYAYTLQS